MHAALLAAVQPDNTPHGYNLTFAFPELMFIIIAGALYLRFRRPHRVPGHADLASAARHANSSAGAATVTAAPAVTVAPPAPPTAEAVDPPAQPTAEAADPPAQPTAEAADPPAQPTVSASTPPEKEPAEKELDDPAPESAEGAEGTE